MSEATTDFVVVGAGQNQLTAAAYLAAAGHGVVVLERHPYWGGGCITAAATLPGFRHDLHATNVFMVKANPLLRLDELGLLSRFGLSYAPVDGASHGTVFDDGSGLALFQDLDRSCADIARFSADDAEAYRRFVRSVLRFMPLLVFALFVPPADGTRFRALLAQSAAGRELLDFFSASALDLIDRHFRDPHTRIHLLRFAAELMMRPDGPGSGFGLMFMAGFYHSYSPGLVAGGAQGFADALVRCLRHHGGEIVIDADVARVLVENGRAVGVRLADGREVRGRQAVIAGLPPWRLHEFVPGTEALAARVERVASSDFTCQLSHLALAEAPRSVAGPGFDRMAFTTLAPLDEAAMLRMTADAAAGKMPNDFSACYVCASNHDPGRAPPGKATLYLYRPVPTRLGGRPASAWDAIRDDAGRAMIEGARRYLVNMSADRILAATHTTPGDFERESPSFRHGDVAALAMTPGQFLDGRPTPELRDYRVPGIDRLYLCGPFMHPGGGANGGGRPVAMRVMMDLGMDLRSVFSL